MRLFITGAAPMSPELHSFLRAAFNAPVCQARAAPDDNQIIILFAIKSIDYIADWEGGRALSPGRAPARRGQAIIVKR